MPTKLLAINLLVSASSPGHPPTSLPDPPPASPPDPLHLLQVLLLLFTPATTTTYIFRCGSISCRDNLVVFLFQTEPSFTILNQGDTLGG